ncbi:MAG: type II secretion system F family protein [Lachnospiraceae bacterium]|nr:type II secretion system F family protein [Lachnospiraceae bacterium]
MKKQNDRLTEGLQKTGERLYQRLFRRVLPVKPQLRRMLQLSGGGTEEAHYGKKIAGALTVLLAGGLLVFLSGVGLSREEVFTRMTRAEYGGATARETLQAQTAAGETLGEYDVTVEARRYTAAEAEGLYEEAFAALPEIIRGENASLDAVTGNLVLPEQLPDYPFRIDWTSSDSRRLRTDGTVLNRDLPAEGVALTLTAGLSYDRDRRTQSFALRILPPVVSSEEALRIRLEQALQEAQEDSVHAESFDLPGRVAGEDIVWTRAEEDKRPVLLLLTVIAAVLMFFAPDRSLQKRMKQREEALRTAYPAFVSRLALYLGAGMTLRAAFLKMAAAEEKGTQLKTELTLMAGWLNNGVPEREAFERFGNRVGLTAYTKLTALLTQNLEKGTALIPLIRAEAAAQTAARLDAAKVRGEQTATRLMLPMMLMLAVVMVLIMVPAFLSF